jgi:glycine betaine/proline transport system permease protein
MFPQQFTFTTANWINAWVDDLVTNYGDVFRHISDVLLISIVNLEKFLRFVPWWMMLIFVAVIAFHATRKILPTVILTGLLFFVGAVGLWDKLMQTLALMLIYRWGYFLRAVIGCEKYLCRCWISCKPCQVLFT